MSSSDSSINPEALAPALDRLVRHATSHGADAVDAIATHGRSLAISVRDGDLEDVDNSENRDVGLRVIVGGRQACVSSSDLSNMSLDALAERAVAMAKLAPEDPYCGLADPDRLETDPANLDLFDETVMQPEDLKARAIDLEKAVKSIDGVSQAEGCNASWSTSAAYFMTSHGFRSGWRSSRHGLSGMALAARDDMMERDYEYDGMRWLSDVRSPETIGRLAGERVIKRLGAKQMPSGSYPVMFDKRVSAAFISALVGAIRGTSIARGTSFLKDELGKKIFSDGITLIDDPFMARGHGSRPWDGEGVSVSRQNIVENGVLNTWLLNSSTARQLELETTGHAVRGLGSPPGIGTSNLYFEPSEMAPEDLAAPIKNGLWVTEMFGPSLNPNTGDYSVGVVGFAIENGEKTYPVNEVTVAGNLKDMFKQMHVASDLVHNASLVSPTLLFAGLTLAGT